MKKKPFYVGDFATANQFGSYIDQTLITRDFCKQSPYDYRLGA